MAEEVPRADQALPDDRQEAYSEIGALSSEPQDLDLRDPRRDGEATAAREKDGSETKPPMYENHVFYDGEGLDPAELNERGTGRPPC